MKNNSYEQNDFLKVGNIYLQCPIFTMWSMSKGAQNMNDNDNMSKYDNKRKINIHIMQWLGEHYYN